MICYCHTHDFTSRILDRSFISFFVHDNEFCSSRTTGCLSEKLIYMKCMPCLITFQIVQRENLKFFIVLIIFCKQFSLWKVNFRIKSCLFRLALYSGNETLTDAVSTTSWFFRFSLSPAFAGVLFNTLLVFPPVSM